MPIRLIDPNLPAGWEPDTPITDSLLRSFPGQLDGLD